MNRLILANIHWRAISIAAIAMLLSCGGSGANKNEFNPMSEEAPNKADAPVLIENGILLERSSGVFHMDEKTHFCIDETSVKSESLALLLRPDFIEDRLNNMLERHLGSRGWPVTIGYTPRVIRVEAKDKQCGQLSQPVRLRFELELNGGGQPYRLTLTARQGENAWMGTLERRDKAFSPKAEYAHPIEGGPVPENTIADGSIKADARELAERFISFFDGAVK